MKFSAPIFQIFFHNLTVLSSSSEWFWHVSSTTFTVLFSVTFVAIIIRNKAPMRAWTINGTTRKFLISTRHCCWSTHHGVSHFRRWIFVKTFQATAVSWSIHFTVSFVRHFTVTSLHIIFWKITHSTLRTAFHPARSTCNTLRWSISKWAWSWWLTKLCWSGPTSYTLSCALPWYISSTCHPMILSHCWPILAVCWSRSHVFYIII